MAELGERHVQPARLVALLHVAPALAAGADADHVHRAVAHAVVAVAREVLCGELPVTRDEPLMHAADHLGAALATVPGVEEQVEVELVAAEIVEEGRSGGVPRRPDRTFVILQLGDLDQPPLAAIELRAIRVLEERHAHQRAVRRVAPAVVGAHELDRVALVVAADLHPAMAAGIQEDPDPPRPVATEDDRLLAHGRHEEVPGAWDLALVTDEEPGPDEDLFLLLSVDLLVHEDLAADHSIVDVDHGDETPGLHVRHPDSLHLHQRRGWRRYRGAGSLANSALTPRDRRATVPRGGLTGLARRRLVGARGRLTGATPS